MKTNTKPQKMKRVLKYLNGNFKDYDYIVVDDSQITNGYMHDTYDDYGVQCSSYDAGDWCFEQSDFRKEAEKEANFDEERFAIEVLDDKHVEITANEEEDADEAKQIEKKMNAWAEQNYYATEAKYIDYFDGHNWRSVIINCDLNYSELQYIDEDEESEILKELETVVNFNPETRDGLFTQETEHYIFTKSVWINAFEYCTVTKK